MVKMDDATKEAIDDMSHESMATLWRRAPAGHPYFQGEVGAYFKRAFLKKGGMTPELSKKIGW